MSAATRHSRFFSLCFPALAMLISALYPEVSTAQNRDYRHQVGLQVVGLDYRQGLRSDRFTAPGDLEQALEFSYAYAFSEYWNLALPVRIGEIARPYRTSQLRPPHVDPELADARLSGSLDLLLRCQPWGNRRFLGPYLFAGGGAMLRREDGEGEGVEMLGGRMIPSATAGLGLQFRLFERAYLLVQGQYRYPFTENNAFGKPSSSWEYSAGVALLLGDKHDRDDDGIKDDIDACPDTKGVVKLNGCPDADGDGVADPFDKCPQQPGSAALDGCPDSDGDGVADIEDQCPTEKGPVSLSGCPDKDGDGIADKNDLCPLEKGPRSLQGCPDADGDGVADKDDDCPTQRGSAALRGCPDRDEDGIADLADKCPDVKGLAPSGCPDTDGDGLTDEVDACPAKAGPLSNRGCPEIAKESLEKLQLAAKAVQFRTGEAKLLSASFGILNEVAAILRQYPEYSLRISGHTDNVGTEAKNLALSQARAEACYDYLVDQGIAPYRLSATGLGSSQPIDDNGYPAGRERNRRTEFELYLPQE